MSHVYAYVPRAQLASILCMGYLSARAQSQLVPGSDAELVRKYASQALEALRDEDASFGADAPTPLSLVLAYLDWREVHTLRGSCAIYFLFAPIPAHLHDAVSRQRHGFLDDRVLVRFALPPECEVYTVGSGGTAQELMRMRASDWTDVWEASLRAHEHDAGVLWLSGIPHGYIVPPTGLIAPADIAVVAA